MNVRTTPFKFHATKSSGTVSGLLLLPDDAEWLYVFAHGAGAGMRHPFMERMSAALAAHKIGTFRYQFPYLERGTKLPDPKPILLATVRSAVAAASEKASRLPLIAGGKSMGGRMTSMAAAHEPLQEVKGIAFVGFPLHPPGKPEIERAVHLSNVSVPMLFLQGTRDALADLELLKPACKKLGKKATLHVVEGADHSFHMLKSSGRTDAGVMEELAVTMACWASKIG